MSQNAASPNPRFRHFWGRVESFRCAGKGIAFMLRTQHNAWIHAAITALVVLAGALLGVSRGEWCWLILAITSVWTAESFNTALEIIVDIASPQQRPAAGRAKDIAAGAVLLCALGASVIGAIVFVPHLLEALRGGP